MLNAWDRFLAWLVDVWDKLIKYGAAAGGAVAGLLGRVDVVFWVLLAFMCIDYVTGWIVAWMGKSTKTETGHLDSNVGAKGMVKKGLMMLVVAMAVLLDVAVEWGLGATDVAVFHSAVIWFYIANEGLSILENMALAGVPFPQRIREALEQLHKKNDKGETMT